MILAPGVEEVEIGWDHRALDAGMAYLSHIFGAYMATYLAEHADKMTSYVRQWAKEAQKSTSADFLQTLEVANEMYATVGPLLEKYQVLVCPTNALPAVRLILITRPTRSQSTEGKLTQLWGG